MICRRYPSARPGSSAPTRSPASVCSTTAAHDSGFSACQAGVPQPSHVLLAMGLSEAEARGALRLSLGRTSTEADVDAFLAALPAVVERARRAGGLL